MPCRAVTHCLYGLFSTRNHKPINPCDICQQRLPPNWIDGSAGLGIFHIVKYGWLWADSIWLHPKLTSSYYTCIHLQARAFAVVGDVFQFRSCIIQCKIRYNLSVFAVCIRIHVIISVLRNCKLQSDHYINDANPVYQPPAQLNWVTIKDVVYRQTVVL